MSRFVRIARAAVAAFALASLATIGTARADDDERDATCAYDAVSASHGALLELARDADGNEEQMELVRSAFATLAECESQVEPAHRGDVLLLEIGDLQNLQSAAVHFAMSKEYGVYAAFYTIKVAQVTRDPETPVTVLKLVQAYFVPPFRSAAQAALATDAH